MAKKWFQATRKKDGIVIKKQMDTSKPTFNAEEIKALGWKEIKEPKKKAKK